MDALSDKVSDKEDIGHFVMTWECYTQKKILTIKISVSVSLSVRTGASDAWILAAWEYVLFW